MKKINRLLAFLLAFTVVITTFSSDLTTAKVFATEEETVIDTEDKINTVEKEEIKTVVKQNRLVDALRYRISSDEYKALKQAQYRGI